jgi:hypothetical protein
LSLELNNEIGIISDGIQARLPQLFNSRFLLLFVPSHASHLKLCCLWLHRFQIEKRQAILLGFCLPTLRGFESEQKLTVFAPLLEGKMS